MNNEWTIKKRFPSAILLQTPTLHAETLIPSAHSDLWLKQQEQNGKIERKIVQNTFYKLLATAQMKPSNNTPKKNKMVTAGEWAVFLVCAVRNDYIQWKFILVFGFLLCATNSVHTEAIYNLYVYNCTCWVIFRIRI